MPSPLRRSLTSRFSFMAGLVTMALALAVIGLVLVISIHRFDTHMEEHSQDSMEFLKEALEVPLWSLDLDAVRAIGNALSQDDLIGLVEIATPGGEVLYSRSKEGGILLEHMDQVSHSGQVIGTIRLGVSGAIRTRTILLVLLTGAGLGILIIILQFLLQALFLKPLLRRPFAELDRIVTSYAQGDFSPEQPENPPTELESLFDILQHMGRTIDQQLEELKDSRERLSLALEGANDGLWDWNISTGKAYFSPRYYTMLGYDADEFEGSHQAWRDLLHPEDRPRVESLLARCMQNGESYETEFRMRNKSGQWNWILSRGRVVEHDAQGLPKRMAGTHVDITERKLAEGARRESETLIRALMNQTQQFLGLMDTDGRMVMVNKTAQEFVGASSDHLQGRYFWDCPWWPDPDRAKEFCDRGMAVAIAGGVFRREVIHVDADGVQHIVDMTLSPFMDDSGQVVYFIPEGRDVTDFVQAREALRESESRFRTIFEKAPYAIAITDQAKGLLKDANQAFLESHGITREESRDLRVGDFSNLSDAEDEAIRREIASSGGVSGREFQFRRRDGKTVDIVYSAVPISYGGEPCILAMTVDVTEQKKAVAAMQASEEKYRAIFNNAPIGIFRTTFDGRVMDCNPALARMLGYADRHEALAAVVNLERDLYPAPEDRRRMLDALLVSPGGLSRDIEFKRKDGSLFHAVINVSLQYDSQGNPNCLDGTIEDVTERKRAEQALRESEERYRQLIENSPMPIHIYELRGDDLIISTANKAVAKLFPVLPEDMIGRSLEEVFPVLKDTIYSQRYRELARGGEPWSFEYIREDGADIVYAFNITAFNISPGRMAVFFVDIKQQKEALRKLRQSEEKFSTLFRLSPDSIMLTDIESLIIADVNETFILRTGYTREEAVGKTTADLGLYADASMRQTVIDILKSKGQFDSLEIEFKGKRGTTGIYSISGRIIPLGGKPYLLTMARDVTEMKKMQEMMVQTEKMISVGGIAAGIAHEINNPLGIVLQAAQNLVQRSRPDFPKNLEVADAMGLDMELMADYMRARKLDVFIEDIRAAALRASSIIRHLLDFSRRSESRRAVCDLQAIVRKALALAKSDYDLKRKYDFKRIHVDLEVDDDLPTINCTETEIEQVLLNLLRNAAQAMAEADPPMEDPRIGVRISRLPDGVRIVVEDNGPGMPPETRRRVFEPFFTTKAPGIGTGLGLSVSYFIITKGHGGRMRVESRPGRGTRFTIELPTEETRQ